MDNGFCLACSADINPGQAKALASAFTFFAGESGISISRIAPPLVTNTGVLFCFDAATAEKQFPGVKTLHDLLADTLSRSSMAGRQVESAHNKGGCILQVS